MKIPRTPQIVVTTAALALAACGQPGDMRTSQEAPFCATPGDVEGKLGAMKRGDESAEFNCYILGAGQRVTIEQVVAKTEDGNIVKVRAHLFFWTDEGFTSDAGMTPW